MGWQTSEKHRKSRRGQKYRERLEEKYERIWKNHEYLMKSSYVFKETRIKTTTVSWNRVTAWKAKKVTTTSCAWVASWQSSEAKDSRISKKPENGSSSTLNSYANQARRYYKGFSGTFLVLFLMLSTFTLDLRFVRTPRAVCCWGKRLKFRSYLGVLHLVAAIDFTESHHLCPKREPARVLL